ncbi:ATP-binding cassette domain-containing protein, partial [Crocinitomicaceae bacterium]|nr:ATP-binding cassette domain-containing protein [Crocinitomicaceae bacterium]
VFMTFIIVFSQFLRPVQNISKNISNMIKSRASQDRINQILDLDDVIKDAPNASNLETFNSNISFENVGFKYDTISVLNGIDFKIQKGQNIALVGESGSGKTTLINLIPRFYDTTSGAIKIDGVDISSLRINDLRAKMALVSQDPILFNSSVIENIAFGDEQPDLNRVTEAAKIANAHTFITQMQEGYESIIGERGSLLSGGQKQRLSIARAMYKNPEILILDEATSALDLESEKLVQEALDRVMNDRTCIVIAHRLSTIRKSDLILVMDQGKVVERGSHEALLKENGFYKKLFDLQIN